MKKKTKNTNVTKYSFQPTDLCLVYIKVVGQLNYTAHPRVIWAVFSVLCTLKSEKYLELGTPACKQDLYIFLRFPLFPVLYPVKGGAQAQPGQAGWRPFTSLQVDNFGFLKLKVKKNKKKRFSCTVDKASDRMFYI